MTVNILEESQLALNFPEPFSNCGIRLITRSQEKCRMSATKFPQSLRFSAKILCRFHNLSHV